MTTLSKEIILYNDKREAEWKEIFIKISVIISTYLPDAENKIWHTQPEWFLDGNPIGEN